MFLWGNEKYDGTTLKISEMHDVVFLGFSERSHSLTLEWRSGWDDRKMKQMAFYTDGSGVLNAPWILICKVDFSIG